MQETAHGLQMNTTNSSITFLTFFFFILVDQVKFAPLRRKETDPYPDLVSFISFYLHMQ